LGVALENILQFVWNALLIAAGVMMGIAALMIFFTISKVIADSSKEIAVFRAIGARRRDVAQIYITYGGMLTASALLFALLIGAAVAFSANLLFGDRYAAMLIQSVGAYTQQPQVQLMGFQPLWLLAVTGAMVVAALIGVSIPTFAALQRKLITILREE
jgi:ABC-type antimicrobial peptide transport system permease subunit